MKIQKQLFRHKPEEGVFGDCFRTAVASVLDLEPQDVPHVYEHGSNPHGVQTMRDWLAGRGLTLVQMVYTCDLDVLFNTMATMNPGIPYLLSGTSRNGTGHVVVACGHEIICDPAIDDSGIVGPMEDGFYWVEFITIAQQQAA